MSENVVGYQRPVDAGVLVGFEVDECIFRYAFMRCCGCFRPRQHRRGQLEGADS